MGVSNLLEILGDLLSRWVRRVQKELHFFLAESVDFPKLLCNPLSLVLKCVRKMVETTSGVTFVHEHGVKDTEF